MERVHAFIKTKRFLLLPIIAIVVFLLVRSYLLANPTKILSYTVKYEDLSDTVQVSGQYTTAAQTTVTSPTNGIITQLFVNNNQKVTKGEKLFSVESTATIDEQNAARTNYVSALSSLQTEQNTKKSLDATMWTKANAYLTAQNTKNYKDNHATNPGTGGAYTDLEKFEIDNSVVEADKAFAEAQQAYTTADIAVGAAQAKVTEDKRLLDETKSAVVTAPATGIVVNLLRQQGDQVSVPQTTAAGTTTNISTLTQGSSAVMVIADLSDPTIEATISEDYAMLVLPGQPVSIVFDGLPSQIFHGRVETIDTVGTDTQGVVTYQARIVGEDLPDTIKPNMTAVLSIETLHKAHVLDVPNNALIDKNGKTYVETAKDKQLIPVTLGTKGMAKTEVTSGLTEGVVILANPQ